ncbi:hypothetical protein FACS1894164_19470 [Spirochaetia bacterium]|nr:hypothetical protein FACS1894164_19470 [Spirochaetia bacterium]
MANKKFFGVMLVMVLAFGLVLAGCPTDNDDDDEFKLDELLREYMSPNPQTWGEGEEAKDVDVYYLDPIRFVAFKAELDAGGEYTEAYDWNEEPGDRTYAILGVRSDGSFSLKLYKKDNQGSMYGYQKNPGASGLKLDKLLRKYMAPDPQTWDEGDETEEVNVYYLDHLRFDEFKAELDAGGKYVQYNNGTWTRDWDLGKTFAQLAVRPNGKVELTLAKADNSTLAYKYNPQ